MAGSVVGSVAGLGWYPGPMPDRAVLLPPTAGRAPRGHLRLLVAGLLVAVLAALTLLGAAGALRSSSAGDVARADAGRVESIIDVGRTAETFVAPAPSKPLVRALSRSGFALFLLLLAALATLAAMAGRKPRRWTTRDARAIAARVGAARLPRRRGPPLLTS